MIKSELGRVLMTKPDYSINRNMHLPDEMTDDAVSVILSADLSCILRSLIERYGAVEALEMWTEVAEVSIELED